MLPIELDQNKTPPTSPSLLRTALQKKKEDKLNDLDSGVGNGQKTIQRNTKINFAVKPISFFFFFLPFLFFSHLFIESTAHYSSSFYHYYFRFLFVRDVEEENEDLKKTTKNKTTPLSRSTVPDIDL